MKSKNIVKRQNPESKAVKPVNWKPAAILGKIRGPEGHRLRWCHDTPENIMKKKAEGWEVLDKTKFPELEHSEYDNRVADSNGLTPNILKRNELVAMILPEELGLERDEYHRRETALQNQAALDNEEAKKLISKISSRNRNNIHSFRSQGISTIE